MIGCIKGSGQVWVKAKVFVAARDVAIPFARLVDLLAQSRAAGKLRQCAENWHQSKLIVRIE